MRSNETLFNSIQSPRKRPNCQKCENHNSLLNTWPHGGMVLHLCHNSL
uniref:Uncharacterized protein n=1 Tax=Anguilla anguilla TaxID=7936 RepID=A0A0E9TGJ8_ANGAN